MGRNPRTRMEPHERVSNHHSSSRELDLASKRRIYLDNGVVVYWIVDPESNSVEVCHYGDGMSETLREKASTAMVLNNGLTLELSVERIFR